MPIPLIPIAVAAAGGVVLAYKALRVNGHCKSCEAALRAILFNSRECAECGAATCSSCIREGLKHEDVPSSLFNAKSPVCPVCLNKQQAALEKLDKAIKRAADIKVFPSTFKGRTSIDPQRPTERGESDWCRSQQAAELQLKVLCAARGFEVVAEREFLKEERANGNYTHSMWKASGTLGHVGA